VNYFYYANNYINCQLHQVTLLLNTVLLPIHSSRSKHTINLFENQICLMHIPPELFQNAKTSKIFIYKHFNQHTQPKFVNLIITFEVDISEHSLTLRILQN